MSIEELLIKYKGIINEIDSLYEEFENIRNGKKEVSYFFRKRVREAQDLLSEKFIRDVVNSLSICNVQRPLDGAYVTELPIKYPDGIVQIRKEMAIFDRVCIDSGEYTKYDMDEIFSLYYSIIEERNKYARMVRTELERLQSEYAPKEAPKQGTPSEEAGQQAGKEIEEKPYQQDRTKTDEIASRLESKLARLQEWQKQDAEAERLEREQEKERERLEKEQERKERQKEKEQERKERQKEQAELVKNFAEMVNKQKEEQKPKKAQKKASFMELVGTDDKEEKEKVIKRLHNLIDGKGGIDVAAILCAAVDQQDLSWFPTEDQYKSEFTLIGTFEATRKYFDIDETKKTSRFKSSYNKY